MLCLLTLTHQHYFSNVFFLFAERATKRPKSTPYAEKTNSPVVKVSKVVTQVVTTKITKKPKHTTKESNKKISSSVPDTPGKAKQRGGTEHVIQIAVPIVVVLIIMVFIIAGKISFVCTKYRILSYHA